MKTRLAAFAAVVAVSAAFASASYGGGSICGTGLLAAGTAPTAELQRALLHAVALRH